MNPYTSTPSGMRRSMIQRWLVIAGVLWFSTVSAQGPQPQRGPRNVDPRWHALLHARVIPEPGRVVEDATIVVRDGVIQWVRSGGTPPPGARVWDYTGRTLVAGFIEPHVTVETPRPPAGARGNHWNHDMVTPQRSALDGDGIAAETRKELRSLGFTSAAMSPRGGMFRGSSVLVALGEGGTAVADRTADVIESQLYQDVALARARFSWSASGPNRALYPSATMGSIALMRQTLSDADWYRQCQEVYRRNPDAHEPPEYAAALEALGVNGEAATTFLFDVRDDLELLRCAKIAEEFHRPAIYLGSGLEFRRLDAIARLQQPILVPLNFPEAPKVDSTDQAANVSLRQLVTWEQGPANLARLHHAGVSVALTTERLSDRNAFHKNLRQAMQSGVSADQALAMLTTTPAQMLGVEGRLGRIAPGHLAHFTIFKGDLFTAQSKIEDVWVGGRRYVVNERADESHHGTWEVTVQLPEGNALELTLGVSKRTVKVTHSDDSTQARGVKATAGRLSFLVDGKPFDLKGVYSFSAVVDGEQLFGSVQGPEGKALSLTGKRVEPTQARLDRDRSDDLATLVRQQPPKGDAGDASDEGGSDEADSESEGSSEFREIPHYAATPQGAYGVGELPAERNLVVTADTLWTSGPRANIDNGMLIVVGGKIVFAGRADAAPDLATFGVEFETLTAAHVTPGLIDCHSHTGVSGSVNEPGQRVTSEVRIGDVIDPDDINWYRQLAGGLTAANQLHGSANAIGGQNSVVKLRWGVAHPDAMKLEGAPSGVKFALGENPKRVAQNTGDRNEYPQTRMGVETLIRDRLTAGRDYDAEWQRYNALLDSARRATMPPRRDLELEAMAEIVRGERWVHCHSYRQDEILMLCRVAQQFGFKIGTFQHVLEGYKIAEAIRDAAVGGSTFADWWAYKFEVIDAIPHNAALMHDVGVVVSINSDSDEHARRLNTEAAKAIKYGGMSRVEALKLVTLNPAIQLGVADQIGSLEKGKDADFVIWSGDPLSYYSRCQHTFIDGREYYSSARDLELRKQANTERNRLVQQLLAQKKKLGGDRDKKKAVTVGNARPLHPLERRRQEIEDALYRAGINPDDSRPGDCGCEGL